MYLINVYVGGISYLTSPDSDKTCRFPVTNHSYENFDPDQTIYESKMKQPIFPLCSIPLVRLPASFGVN